MSQGVEGFRECVVGASGGGGASGMWGTCFCGCGFGCFAFKRTPCVCVYVHMHVWGSQKRVLGIGSLNLSSSFYVTQPPFFPFLFFLSWDKVRLAFNLKQPFCLCLPSMRFCITSFLRVFFEYSIICLGHHTSQCLKCLYVFSACCSFLLFK